VRAAVVIAHSPCMALSRLSNLWAPLARRQPTRTASLSCSWAGKVDRLCAAPAQVGRGEPLFAGG
jgi:hypothetical protein